MALPITAAICSCNILKVNLAIDGKLINTLTAITTSAFVVTIKQNTHDDKMTGFGLFLRLVALFLSAGFQAIVITLEKRIFDIERELPAIAVQNALAQCKIMIVTVVFVYGMVCPSVLNWLFGFELPSITLITGSIYSIPLQAWLSLLCFVVMHTVSINTGL